MTRNPLDPNLASILDSIRATVGGEPLAQAPTGPAPNADAPPAHSKAANAPPPRSVEEFLADMIRPQVEAWLAAHLPELVHKMAADEIARLTGRK